METNLEKRIFQIRKFTEDEGTFEAYVVTWDTVDSFGTRFKRGAFRKTLNERLKRGDIKVLWQHQMNEPIGLVLDAKEDDVGLLIHGKLDTGVPRADQARAQMKSGTINQFSIGFDIIQQKRADDGFIDIREARLWESSPVTFAANPETSILNVRSYQFVKDGEVIQAEEGNFFSLADDQVVNVDSFIAGIATRALQLLNAEFEKNAGIDGGLESSLPGSDDGSQSADSGSPSTQRAIDFDETFDGAELNTRWYRILDALGETIWDILYSGEGVDIISSCDAAFEKAHARFMDWATEAINGGTRAVNPNSNILSEATQAELGERSVADVAKDSPLSEAELSQLLKGNLLPLSSRGRLAEFSKTISTAHAQVRAEKVSQLFEEIRVRGFSPAEQVRLKALLSTMETAEPDDNENTAVLGAIRELNQTFKQ